MPFIPVSDLADPRLDDYLHLKDVALRKRLEPAGGLYMAESTQVIGRALNAGHKPRSVLVPERYLEHVSAMLAGHDLGEVPVFVGTEELLESITGFHLHRGALAAMHRPQLPALADVLARASRVAIFDGIVDHTNLGAGFRSAAALGVDCVLVTPSCADPLYRRAVRVSMGTVFQVPWTRLEPWPAAVSSLQAAGFVVAALALTPQARSLDSYEVPERFALVMGPEGAGLSRRVLLACDLALEIPMSHAVDSLNVAAAAAVAFWATRKRLK